MELNVYFGIKPEKTFREIDNLHPLSVTRSDTHPFRIFQKQWKPLNLSLSGHSLKYFNTLKTVCVLPSEECLVRLCLMENGENMNSQWFSFSDLPSCGAI